MIMYIWIKMIFLYSKYIFYTKEFRVKSFYVVWFYVWYFGKVKITDLENRLLVVRDWGEALIINRKCKRFLKGDGIIWYFDCSGGYIILRVC